MTPDDAIEGLPIVKAFCKCPACVARTTAMYDVAGACNNCGQRFTVRNRKGDQTPLMVTCPACEVTVFGWKR